MLSKDQALLLISEQVVNKNIVKHMLAVEALMGRVFEELKKGGKNNADLGGTKEEWMMAGLLHDGDYCDGVPAEKQGVRIVEWAKGKGFEVPENVAQAIAAHNWQNTKVEPKSLMDWTIYIGDSLTGLIVASALVLPSKKLADLTVESVLKRFKEKSFAKGTRREDLLLCEEKLGFNLTEFVTITLKAMQLIADELGL